MLQPGRRGRSQTRGPTHGLIWARTRHATSRAGDPEPHDHVLIANVCHMADGKGGWKAVDTAALRDILHAATAFGRVASAAKAIQLGYAIEADDGPSVESKGYDTYQARQTAARDTRKTKRHTPPADLMAGWLDELSAAGYSPGGMLDDFRGLHRASREESSRHRAPDQSDRSRTGRYLDPRHWRLPSPQRRFRTCLQYPELDAAENVRILTRRKR